MQEKTNEPNERLEQFHGVSNHRYPLAKTGFIANVFQTISTIKLCFLKTAAIAALASFSSGP
jgi:hypothetical protein